MKVFSAGKGGFGLLLIGAIYAFAGVSAPAQAQEGGATDVMIEEIVTTARRKNQAESLQSVPVSVSAFNSAQLEASQFSNLQDITATVPNANAESLSTYPGFVNFSIRGTGTAGSALSDEPTVGIFVDGVYQGIAAGMLLDRFDIESVEVLRGPQGTLFGRNVTGGAVLMRTSVPTEEFKAKVKLGAGNYGSYSLAAVVSGPISEDKLLGKLAVFHNQRDDYVTNISAGNPLAPNAADLGEKDQQVIRGALTWLVGDSTQITFRAEHMQSDEDSGLTDNIDDRRFGSIGLNAAFGALNPPSNIIAPDFGDSEKTGGDLGAETPHTEMNSASLDITWQVGNGTMQSLTAWRDFVQEDMEQDFDNTLLPLFEIWEHTIGQEQVSQEFIYNNDLTDTMSLTAGFYYFDQSVSNNDFRISGGAFGGRGAHITYSADHEVVAALGSLDFVLGERWNMTVGGRFSNEKKSASISNVGAFAATGGTAGCSADGILPTQVSGMNPRDEIDFGSCVPSYNGSNDWSTFSPKVVAQFLISDNSQVYGSYSRGFRSGGFSTRGRVGTDPLFNEEGIDAFELGIKHSFSNGARVNAALFHNSIDDMQRNVFVSVATGEQITRNAAEAILEGAEVEATIPIGENLLVQGSLGYIDATYDTFIDNISGADHSGNLIPFIAEWQRDLSVTWDIPLAGASYLSARAAYHFRDEYHNVDSNEGYVSPDATTYDASIAYHSGQWTLTAFGKNLSDETTQGPATDVVLWVVTNNHMPRTYGVEFVWYMQ